ncbi:MAG: ribonuclease P [Candidatus Micrarchaeota archaeon]
MKKGIDARKIAEERCTKLLALAKKMWSKDEKLALRYVDLARRIGMRHRVRLGGKEFCRKCGTPFVFGATVKKRLDSKNKFIVLECIKCGVKRRTKKYKN